MKKNFLFLILLLIGLFTVFSMSDRCYAKASKGPQFEYTEEGNRIDLGTIYIDELEEINLEIEFENTGDEPLIISNVRACCGTRVKDYPKEPISPGDRGVIEVHFRLAPRPHNISRTVITQSNDPDGQKVLRISGEVADR